MYCCNIFLFFSTVTFPLIWDSVSMWVCISLYIDKKKKLQKNKKFINLKCCQTWWIITINPNLWKTRLSLFDQNSYKELIKRNLRKFKEFKEFEKKIAQPLYIG